MRANARLLQELQGAAGGSRTRRRRPILRLLMSLTLAMGTTYTTAGLIAAREPKLRRLFSWHVGPVEYFDVQLGPIEPALAASARGALRVVEAIERLSVRTARPASVKDRIKELGSNVGSTPSNTGSILRMAEKKGQVVKDKAEAVLETRTNQAKQVAARVQDKAVGAIQKGKVMQQDAQAQVQALKDEVQTQAKVLQKDLQAETREFVEEVKETADVAVKKVQDIAQSELVQKAQVQIKQGVNVAAGAVQKLASDAVEAVKDVAVEGSKAVEKAIQSEESGLMSKPSTSTSTSPRFDKFGRKVYEGPPLPLNFELPYDYVMGKAPKTTPTVSSLNKMLVDVSPPFKTLAQMVDVAVSRKPKDLEAALVKLARYIESAEVYMKDTLRESQKQFDGEQEKMRENLKKQLDGQREQFQQQLDVREAEWQQAFVEETNQVKAHFQQEIKSTQDAAEEVIEKRLQAQVLAQAVELQRRWARQIRSHVEKERAGRLSELRELGEEVEALSQMVEKIETRPVIPLMANLEGPISARFSKVSREISSVAMLRTPDETPLWQIPLSYAAGQLGLPARLISTVSPSAGTRYAKTMDALQRANGYLKYQDLDSAARECAQLTGWPALIAHDWLNSARDVLEKKQQLRMDLLSASIAI